MTDKIHKHIHKKQDNILEIKNLSISYSKQKIINNISFNIKRNSFVTIAGINGSGKSTIIKAIMQLTKYRGTMIFQNKNIKKINKKELAKQIAYVPQLFEGSNEVTVREYISFGRFPYSKAGFLSKKDWAMVDNIIKKMKLSSIKNKFLNQISGGQRQKVSVASALVQEAEIIILDEPTTYLDLKNQYEILEIAHLIHIAGKTVITVLHDLNQAIKYSDNVILLNNKEIFKEGSPHSVFSKKNIREVFGVTVMMKVLNERKHIIDIETQEIMDEVKWF